MLYLAINKLLGYVDNYMALQNGQINLLSEKSCDILCLILAFYNVILTSGFLSNNRTSLCKLLSWFLTSAPS